MEPCSICETLEPHSNRSSVPCQAILNSWSSNNRAHAPRGAKPARRSDVIYLAANDSRGGAMFQRNIRIAGLFIVCAAMAAPGAAQAQKPGGGHGGPAAAAPHAAAAPRAAPAPHVAPAPHIAMPHAAPTPRHAPALVAAPHAAPTPR